MTTLTRREREVCGYLCRGLSNREIGEKLMVSHRTVDDHRCHILKKYRCRNVVELVREVYQLPEEVPA